MTALSAIVYRPALPAHVDKLEEGQAKPKPAPVAPGAIDWFGLACCITRAYASGLREVRGLEAGRAPRF